MNEKKYTINEVCNILNCKTHNLRYIEKALDIHVGRDEFLNRVYTQEDINRFKMIYELKDQGLNYQAIKKVLDHQEDIIQDVVEDTRKDIVIKNDNVEQLIELLTKKITEEVKVSVLPMVEELSNEVESLKVQNEELQRIILKNQEDHFSEFDNKLTKIREEMSQNQKKSLLERLFKH